MRTKVTLVLVFLNVALFFFIFKFERNWRTEAASLEARKRVLGAETADIRSLEIASSAPGGSFALVKQRDAWTLTRPFEWPANPHAVNAILTELRLLEHEAFFPTKDLAKSGRSLADYGLDKPRLTLAFTSGDAAAAGGALRATTLALGDTTGNRLYLLSPDGERVHVVNRSLVETISRPLGELRSDTLLTIPVFEARMLSLQIASSSPDQNRAGLRVRVRRDNARWVFDTPHTARASRAAVEIVVNQLNALRVKTFNPTPAPAALPSVAPALRISLEGNGRHETLFLGDPVPTAAAPGAPAAPAATPASPASPETEYFAQLEGRPALFTVLVPNGLVETLRAAADRLREKRFLPEFEAATVTSVTLAAPGSNQPPVTLQRLEAAGAAAGSGAWQIVRRGDGAQGLQTAPADSSAVEGLLARLAQLSAQTFVSDSPSSAQLETWGFNRPEREITLTLAGAPAGGAANAGLTLRLGTDAEGRVYARVAQTRDTSVASVYGVDLDFRTLFPVAPDAWRDRTLPALPPNARLTALKLTDLGTRQVVFETAFDAAGQPATAGLNAAALQTVTGHLRTPRARNFRPGRFTEQVFAAGEERAWKYQLDATIAVPGREQAETRTLFLLDRTGGAQQLAGSKEFDAVFELEQTFLDALWLLTYGPRDPGAPPAPPTKD